MSFPPPTAKQARVLWFSLTTLMVVVILCLVAVAIDWLLARLSPVLLPVALALVLAYILDPLVEFLARKKLPRIWAILLVFLVCIAATAGLIGSVTPDLIKETRRLVNVLDAKDLQTQIKTFTRDKSWLRQFAIWGQPASTNHVILESPRAASGKNISAHVISTNVGQGLTDTNSTNGVEVSITIATPVRTNSDGTIETNKMLLSANTKEIEEVFNAPFSETIVPALAAALVKAINWIPAQLGKVTTWVEFLVGFVLVPVYLFYFLLEKHGINKHWTDYLPVTESRAKEELVFVLKAINECMVVFFRGQVLVAMCVGVLLTASYLLLGLNYAVLLGCVAATLGVVPYLGTITSLAIALTVAAVQFGDWAHPLGVLGIAACVKMLEDFVISPKIIGDRSGLHPLTIILAVMIGAKLMGGFLGALLAVPLTAVLRTLMFRYVWKKRPRKSKVAEPRETADIAS
jgi:predicted PurR-regulated permease PerM